MSSVPTFASSTDLLDDPDIALVGTLLMGYHMRHNILSYFGVIGRLVYVFVLRHKYHPTMQCCCQYVLYPCVWFRRCSNFMVHPSFENMCIDMLPHAVDADISRISHPAPKPKSLSLVHTTQATIT